ncbi:MAG: hypothetical protein LUQ50_03630 [Methanospirillum sp.]|uniref:hypothetical protein n=1 Tax=Methanospirillum sp. TaxID=45200 RepID=UPI002371ACA4|nr:hypothetical protein [Methanospirillum sp.]MDD1728144.1 hypothetical protein [Methanospirillum sp.]
MTDSIMNHRGVALLAFLVLWVWMAPAGADQVPNLTGTWDGISVDTYSESGGYENATGIQEYQITLTQEGRFFAGNESYRESANGPVTQEPNAGVISSDGKYFWRDHDRSGISFGEMLSDHEYMDYMLFPNDGPLVIAAHLVKNGTQPSGVIPEPVNLTGTWNTTSQRRENGTAVVGTVTITDQQGSLFSGLIQVPEENGTLVQMKIFGVTSTNGRFYAVTDSHAYYVGDITGEDSIHYVVVHPQDDDETFVLDRQLTRNAQTPDISPATYPDLAGDWNITARTVIQNGTITHTEASDTEWMAYSDQTGPFFTATRHSDDPTTPPVMKISGIFNGETDAFLASAAPTYVLYHIIDENIIEAIVMRKEGDSRVYVDTLVRNLTS